MNFITILDAIKDLQNLNKSKLVDISDKFGKATFQEIPQHVVAKFSMTGLANEDFLTSDFLNQYGYKNIFQVDLGKCAYELEKIQNTPSVSV